MVREEKIDQMVRQEIPFNFEIPNISGSELGIVDYFSCYLNFEAPERTSFDKLFVIESIVNLFSACDTFDKLHREKVSKNRTEYLQISVSKSNLIVKVLLRPIASNSKAKNFNHSNSLLKSKRTKNNLSTTCRGQPIMCNHSRQFTGIKYMQTPTISTNLDSTNLIYAQPIEGDQF